MAMLRLSYADLGARLGRSADTARVLARRRGWQRVTGNDGRVAVMVDEVELAAACPPGRPGGDPAGQADIVSGPVPLPAVSDRNQADLDQLRAELAVAVGQLADNVVLLGDLRAELADARIAAARAEGEAAGKRLAAMAELAAADGMRRAEVDALRELADRLTAELAEARRPWWRRWIG